MADVLLGISGSEVTLPQLSFMGSPPMWSESSNKQIEKAVMSDGSFNWNFTKIAKIWTIELGFLSNAWLVTLRGLNALNQILRFKDENKADIWYDVVITSFNDEDERMDIRQLDRYRVSMTLEEAA